MNTYQIKDIKPITNSSLKIIAISFRVYVKNPEGETAELVEHAPYATPQGTVDSYTQIQLQAMCDSIATANGLYAKLDTVLTLRATFTTYEANGTAAGGGGLAINNSATTLNGDVNGSGTGDITVSLKEINAGGTANKVIYDTKGRVTGGSSLTASDIPALDWGKIVSGKPNTLAGYGIVDGNSGGGGVGGTTVIQAPTPMAVYNFQLANNVTPPTLTQSAWNTLLLNTTEYDSIGAPLTNGSVKLSEGSYYVDGWCVYSTASGTGNCKIVLYNATASAVMLQGSNTSNGGTAENPSSTSILKGVITVVAGTDVQLRIFPTNSVTWYAQPSSGEPQDFAGLAITKISTSSSANIKELASVGEICYFAKISVPDGFLVADGRPVSRTTYAELFTAISINYGAGDGNTTFNLPDLRGEFIRGWDSGRGIDSGRTFGSKQLDEFKSHTHTVQMGYTDSDQGYFGGGRGHWGDQATLAAGGAETRPRNIALLACIRHTTSYGGKGDKGDPGTNGASAGEGQTWTNVSSSRASGVVYTNSTGKTIDISAWAVIAASAFPGGAVGAVLVISGVTVKNSWYYTPQDGLTASVYGSVPNGATYSITFSSINYGYTFGWAELR